MTQDGTARCHPRRPKAGKGIHCVGTRKGAGFPPLLHVGFTQALLLVALGVLSLVVVLLAGIEALLRGAAGAARMIVEVLLALGGVVAVHLAFAHRDLHGLRVNRPWEPGFPQKPTRPGDAPVPRRGRGSRRP